MIIYKYLVYLSQSRVQHLVILVGDTPINYYPMKFQEILVDPFELQNKSQDIPTDSHIFHKKKL